jgi:hypothetical protein
VFGAPCPFYGGRGSVVGITTHYAQDGSGFDEKLCIIFLFPTVFSCPCLASYFLFSSCLALCCQVGLCPLNFKSWPSVFTLNSDYFLSTINRMLFIVETLCVYSEIAEFLWCYLG